MNKDFVDRGEIQETKAVVVDCTDYQLTVVPFVLAIAKALHTCGGITLSLFLYLSLYLYLSFSFLFFVLVPAHRMERMLTLLSNCFGIDAHFFYTPTGSPIFYNNFNKF